MSIEQKKVSLILCGYNAVSTMRVSLDSAIAQTLDSLEILCVNDGSTDQTLEVFREYERKDSRIKVIDLPCNKGLLAARKAGVDEAVGKYIMFLDLDDSLLPEACLELSQKMDETNSDMVQFGIELLFVSEEDKAARGAAVEAFFSCKTDQPLFNSDDILKACFLQHQFVWNVWCKIYKTELARKVYSHVPDDMKVVMAEDTFAFLLAASMAESLTFTDKKYYRYNVGSGVSGVPVRTNEIKSLIVYYKLIKPLADNKKSAVFHQVVDELGKHFRWCLSCNLQSKNADETYKTIFEQLKETFGFDQMALLFVENWNMTGFHPMKTSFLGCCSKISSNLADNISTIGVISTESQLSSSLLKEIHLLHESGYKIELFIKECAAKSVQNSLDFCRISVFSNDSDKLTTFFSDESIQTRNDAYIYSYGEDPNYELMTFLLLSLRFVRKKPFFALLKRPVEQLNCHDKIYLGLTDCVLERSEQSALLFGNIGLFSESGKNTFGKIITRFEKKIQANDKKILSSSRRLMKNTVEKAIASLGCAGFGDNTIDKSKLEQKLSAHGSPLTADDYCLIRESGFFDDEFYRKQFPDIVIDDAIIHFCMTGTYQLASPSAIFNLKIYAILNQDLIFQVMNLLIHYLRYGIYEGRKIASSVYEMFQNSKYFDEKRYCKEYGNELGDLDPLTHYFLFGWKKGYLPSELFVDKHYYDFYLLDGYSMPSLFHYIYWGTKEGRAIFPLKPVLKQYFPENYDIEQFWQHPDKCFIVVHQLDFTGVPILSKMLAEIFREEKNAAIISPIDGPLRESCVKAGIPVLIDSDFFIHTDRAAFYKENGVRICLYNTVGLLKSFLRNAGIIPSVLWIHDNVTKDDFPEHIQKQIKFAPTVFATSKITLNLVREYNQFVRYLPYPVKDMGGHHKTTIPQKIRFGVLGSYTERKGQDIAIKAFKALPEALKAKAELLLIGSSTSVDYEEKLKALADGEKNIHFLPTQKDPEAYHRLYEEMEVQLCPSKTDPMPLVVFDGMMHGCPLILSDTVGQSEFIRNGENGYVFPAEDEIALKDQMVKLIENMEHFPELSKAVRQTFLDNFEFGKAAEAIRKVLGTVKKYF